MKLCSRCGDVLEFVYHACRGCERWESEEHEPPEPSTRVPFLTREAVKPKPHRTRGAETIMNEIEKSVKGTLVPLLEELEQATDDERICQGEERAASSRHTASVNRLNNAQKAIDAALMNLRKSATNRSDWFSRTRGSEHG